MRIASNAHVHTTLCDGASTPEELAEEALRKGFTSLGITGHAFSEFDQSYCMTPDRYPRYLGELARLRERYRGRLQLVAGMEQEFFAPIRPEHFGLSPDCPKGELPIRYRIASVHYIRSPRDGTYYEVDLSPEEVERCRDEAFGGDALAMVRAFYEESVQNAKTAQGDILGHFDLIRKLNVGMRFFDEDSPEYRDIALGALEEAAGEGIPFEVNTAGYRNGRQNQPYPALFLLRRLRELGGRVIVTSDCHRAEHLDFEFDRAAAQLRELGFSSVLVLRGGEELFGEQAL